ncbi:hypothetical protein JCM8202_001989 [Rhodotorula sphaerocarpa]
MQVAQPDRRHATKADPFPLFHLSDLDFDVSAEAIPVLPAYQLAFAPWSTAWSEALEPALKRTWRRKRERSRVQINNKVPCGVFASDDDRKKEPLFPKFELIPLDFDLSAGEALPHLTSAQLAVVQFHPNGIKDLTLAAEDIFFSRRERDFAAGLSLPQNGEPLPASVPVPVPAPEPEPVAAPAIPPPAAAAAPPSAPAANSVAPVAAAPVAASVTPTAQAGSTNQERAAAKAPSARSRSTSRSRDASHRDRGRDRDCERERERARDRDGERDRDRARSWRSSRERDRDGDADSRRSERRRSRSRSLERGSGSRRSGRHHSRSRSPDRATLSRRLAEEKQLSLARGSRASDASLSTSHRKRGPSPTPSDPRLRDSVRRRIEDEKQSHTSGPSSRQTPPPSMPMPNEELPRDIFFSLKTCFLRRFPGTLSAGDVDAWVRSTVAATTGASVHPVGIKMTSRANQDKTPHQDPRVTLAFVTFQDEAEARQVIDAADKKHYGNRVILANGIRDIPERRTWRWSDFTPDFVEEQYRQRLEQYEARGAALQGAPGSYSHASLPSRPFMVPSAQQFPIEMQNGGAASSSYSAAPAAGADPAIRLSELPDHLVSRLSVLYVTNVPTTVTLSEARTFFDDCDKIVGMALDPPDDPRADMATVWIAFEASADRQKATQRLHNARFPGSPKKFWFESAEGRARKTGEGHIWIWQNMSRDYRQRHGGPGTSSSQGPGSPAGFRTAMPPHFLAQAGYGDYRSPMPIARSGHMPEVAPYETMPMLPPGNGSGYAIPMSSAPAYEAFPQGPMAGASEKAYSPTQPHMNLLRSFFLGMSPPAPAPPSYSMSQAGPAGAVPVTTTIHTAAAGNINPERLAILQASLEAAGYSPGAAGSSVSDPRPDAATEKQQAEEAARLAWSSRRRTSMNSGPTTNGDAVSRDPRLSETRHADAILHIKGAAQSDGRPSSPSKSSVAASSQIGHQAQSPWNDSGSANPTAGAGPTNAEDTTIADTFISEALRVDLTPQVSQDTADQPVHETPQPSMEGPAEGASSQAPSEAAAPEAPQVSPEQTLAGTTVD